MKVIKNIFLNLMFNFLENYNDSTFLPGKTKFEKVKKLAVNLHDKTEYVICIRNLKQALNHGLVLRKTHSVIQDNQKTWLKPYIDMNTNLKKAKMTLRKTSQADQ